MTAHHSTAPCVTTESNLDRCARELYDRRAPHWPGCGELLSLADQLAQTCPHCRQPTYGQGLAPEISPERAAGMLAELRARRCALALAPHAAAFPDWAAAAIRTTVTDANRLTGSEGGDASSGLAQGDGAPPPFALRPSDLPYLQPWQIPGYYHRRNLVKQRDGKRCCFCGELTTKGNLCFDRVIPLAAGGDDSVDNLRVAHVRCKQTADRIRRLLANFEGARA